MNLPAAQSELTFDVVIMGGAFTGASVGLLLRRKMPGARILIVERREVPDRKVGESTSEVAGCFLHRELGIYDHLSKNHLTKHGLRLWFTTPENDSVGQCGEIGPHFQSRLVTFQLDRAVLDPYILKLAQEAGCEVWKPAKVESVELEGLGQNILQISVGGEERTVCAKWVVDASGKAAVIPRMRKTLTNLAEHPTNAVWARFSNVRTLDDPELMAEHPEMAKAMPAPRNVATNHLCGYGWWCWIIPLRDGDVSVGVTYDSRLYTLPPGATLTERLHQHVLQHPVGRYLFKDAVPVEKDTRTYTGLPYYSTEVAGDGWLVCGDAAGFMDPLYSQGLDYCAHTAKVCVDILHRSLGGHPVETRCREYSEEFQSSYFRWWNALYRDKYHYLGDLELMWPAFLLDIGSYFVGPVRLVYDHPEEEWLKLPYNGPAGKLFSTFMSLYNRRLVRIAQKRMAAGCYGRNNLNTRLYPRQGFSPDMMVMKLLRKGIWAWLKCEWHALWLKPVPQPEKLPQALPSQT